MHGSVDLDSHGSWLSSSKTAGSRATVPFRYARSPPDRVTSHFTLHDSESNSTGVIPSDAVVPDTEKSGASTSVTGSSKVSCQVSSSALVSSVVGDSRKTVSMFGEA